MDPLVGSSRSQWNTSVTARLILLMFRTAATPTARLDEQSHRSVQSLPLAFVEIGRLMALSDCNFYEVSERSRLGTRQPSSRKNRPEVNIG